MKFFLSKLFLIILCGCFATFANAQQNDTLELCSKEYRYCINIENPNLFIELKHSNSGSFGFGIKKYKTSVVVVGTKYQGGHWDGLDVSFLKDELFKGWREMEIKNWTTRYSFEQDNTATFIYGSLENNIPMLTYRFVKYDEKNGYVELYATYPTKHENVIRPMLEQMANSITIQ